MIIVLDLDGTLSRVNTYKVFLLVLTFYIFITFQWNLAFALIRILYKRFKRISSRERMKFEIFNLYLKVKGKKNLHYIFHAILNPFYRRDIIEKNNRGNNRLILATAAYEFYAKEIAKKLGIAEFVATTWAEMKNELECIGERKKNRIFSLSNLSNIDLFYTDHHDDIPTMLVSNKTILVNPTSRSYKLVTKSLNHSKIESY